MENKKILGIDLGTNSIGWAVLELLEKEKTKRLLDKGVVLFEEGVIIEKGNEKSKAAERTKYRSARRLIFRRKLRKYQTLKVLAENNMVPLSIEEVERWRSSNFNGYPINDDFFEWLRTDDKFNKNPYYLRAKAVNEKLSSMELGRVMYHLAQRRGFLSNRLEQKDDKNKGQVKENIAEITKKIEKTGAKSLGEYFWKLYQQDRNSSENKIRKNYLGRKEHYLKEFELICKTQELSPELCAKLKKAIFYQRPLKSQKGLVGKCVFEPKKARIPISHPLFEEFRMWSFINNIKIKTPNDESLRFLTTEEKEKIIPLFESAPSNKTIKFEKIAKKLIAPEFKKAKIAKVNTKEARTAHYLVNYNLNTSVSTSPVRAFFKKYLGDDWATKEFQYQVKKPNGEPVSKSADYNDIWHVLFTFEDDEKLKEYIITKLKLSEKNVESFAKFDLPQGYGSLSKKAITKILPFLHAGFTYDKAVMLAKIPEIIGHDIWGVEENREEIINEIDKIFEGNTVERKIITAVNKTIYQIHDQGIHDKIAIEHFLESNIKDVFGNKSFNELADKDSIKQTALNLLNERLRFSGIENRIIKQKTKEEKVQEYLVNNFNLTGEEVSKLYHPSMMDIYKKPPVSIDGKRYLASPIIDSIKNPVMMRSMHLLKKLINRLIQTGLIDEETVIHIELARDLNDANTRAAIKKYQRERENENEKFRKEIENIFKEQNIIREVSKDDIKRYRLWIEQNEISIYTGETIGLHELFDGTKYDFEHTVPQSVSYDNSLANLTITESYFNRDIKKNKLPTELDNYNEIKVRLEGWEKELKDLENKIERNKKATKGAVTKEARDSLIQNRRYLELKRDYWYNKIKNFTIEEVTDRFKNSQLNDTRLITKYARAYLKSVFNKVHVVNGRMVSEFRKLWGIQEEDEKKSRANHIHHAVDAIVIASMTRNLYNKIAEAYHLMEDQKKEEARDKIKYTKPWRTFTEDVKNIYKETLIYHDIKDVLPKHTKKKIRKRGIIQYRYVQELPEWFKIMIDKGIYKENKDYFVEIKEGKKLYKIPKYKEGDTARGVLHRDTYYGAIARKDENGNILKDKNGEILVDYVVRKSIDEIKKPADAKKIIDPVIRKIVEQGISKKDALNKEIDELKKQLKNTTEEKEKEINEEIKKLENERNNLFRLPIKKGGFVPIKKVRIKSKVTNPIKDFKKHRDLSNKEYKQFYYVENEENYAMAIYEGVNEKGEVVRDYEKPVQNIEAANYFKRTQYEFRKEHPLVPARKKGLPLKYILRKGISVLFYNENPDELKDLPKEELVKRLYIITETQKAGRIYFIPHQLSGNISDNKKEAISKVVFSGNMLLLTKKNWNFIVDKIDFELSIDGKITWLF